MAGRVNMKKEAGAVSLIAERFDARTLANMEVALDRACRILPAGSERHEARRYIASRILRCAKGGDLTLGGLTEAGRAATTDPAIYRKLDKLRDLEKLRDRGALGER
jgi:hypothetical protein